jgi:hypothetical protein
MIKPINDKAEVFVDFPGKTYMGSFTRHSGFGVTADKEGVHIQLEHRVGEHRRVGLHIHYRLLADLLEEIGEALRTADPLDKTQQKFLLSSAEALQQALVSLKERDTSSNS